MEMKSILSTVTKTTITVPPTKKQRAEWILKIKEINKLTQSCTENILHDVTHLCSSIIADLTAEGKGKLVAYNMPSGLDKVLQSDSYSNPFKNLETGYKQKQYLRECFNFVVRTINPSVIVCTHKYINKCIYTARNRAPHTHTLVLEISSKTC